MNASAMLESGTSGSKIRSSGKNEKQTKSRCATKHATIGPLVRAWRHSSANKEVHTATVSKLDHGCDAVLRNKLPTPRTS